MTSHLLPRPGSPRIRLTTLLQMKISPATIERVSHCFSSYSTKRLEVCRNFTEHTFVEIKLFGEDLNVSNNLSQKKIVFL